MASTRNRNTVGNYKMELQQDIRQENYYLYKHSQYGEAIQTHLPGNGLLPGQLPRDKLSKNPIDIESFLFGINSTNLVKPAPILHPKLDKLSVTNIYPDRKVIMPTPLLIEKDRPFPTF
jgi:hypothetical protein